IDDSHLNELSEQKQQLNKELQKQINIQASRNTQIDDVKQRWRDAEAERLKVRNRLGKTNTSAENWDIAATVKNIFGDIMNILKEEELEKVSWEMKRIFLAMIGADSASERMSGIKSAELTKQFDIK
ncbi:hypothetical protein, partial [Haloferax sp. KTX1]|uniref:hypothetical protein n=1 Tax=Haloferax sp. KTX1 TaxID=2600597 RepID=UPI0016522567